jgi:hypothetical protein
LMATDNGTGVILDIERFDQEPDASLFHGRIKLSQEDLSPTARQTNPNLWNKISSEIIGIEFMEENLLNSLVKIGQTLGGVPQLGAAAVMSGALLSICVARIILDQPLNGGKYIFSTEATLNPEYNGPTVTERRNETRSNFKNALNS